MNANTFGVLFRLTTYGESHGPGLGGIVDGCPPGLPLTEAMVQEEVDRRKPGQGPASTTRKESDRVRLLSGVFEGLTTGTPIAFHAENQDQRSRDYSAIKDIYRPGHADYTFEAKFGVRDYRGGGRSSGRETLSRVAGGAIAKALLDSLSITVDAYTLELGGVAARPLEPETALSRPFFSPDPEAVDPFEERIRRAKAEGDSLGGVVEIRAKNVPPGLGEPVFDKLDARLACGLMSVGAVKAVEIGSGTAASRSMGSENNDPILPSDQGPVFGSNNAGGILGGISNGDEIVTRAHVKPIPSIAKGQKTVTRQGEEFTLSVPGRHDVSAIPRIVPVLRAMVLLTLADFILLQRRNES